MTVIGNLNASTKYYVRVLASTKVGRGNYSKIKGKFTNGGKFSCFIWKTPQKVCFNWCGKRKLTHKYFITSGFTHLIFQPFRI